MYDGLDHDTLVLLLELAHRVIIGTTQDTLKKDSAYMPHLLKARDAYLKARADALAPVQAMSPLDVLDLYKYGAGLQPWNHQFPWNCPSYYDGCNCEGGPYYDRPETSSLLCGQSARGMPCSWHQSPCEVLFLLASARSQMIPASHITWTVTLVTTGCRNSGQNKKNPPKMSPKIQAIAVPLPSGFQW